MLKIRNALSALTAALLLCWMPAAAKAIPVDTLLALSVDVSGSTNRAEFELMVNGIADAFDSVGVQNAIAGGAEGSIAVSLYMWSSQGQEQDIAWTQVTAATAGQFASDVRALLSMPTQVTIDSPIGPIQVDSSSFGLPVFLEPYFLSATDNGMGGVNLSLSGGNGDGFGQTAVAQAIDFGVGLFGQGHGFTSSRSVIDVTGDGFENFDFNAAGCNDPSCQVPGVIYDPLTGSPIFDPDTYFEFVSAARDAAEAAGIVINGLPILTDVSDLDQFYADYVVTGAGAFVEPAINFSDFANAFETKLTQEIVPEPTASVLLIVALGGLASRARRRA